MNKIIVITLLLAIVYSQTVQQQINAKGCGTVAVAGLSEQLLQAMNQLKPGLMSRISSLKNVRVTAPTDWIQTAAIKDLQNAINSRGTQMTINSGLRTLPQQLMLYKWYEMKACGIPLAAKPGRSNHESGLAIDINDASNWISHLERNNWKYFGPKDPVHFDYTKGTSIVGTSVLAFQRLWNCNNPNDRIGADGLYGPATESRLLQSPAKGFSKVCI